MTFADFMQHMMRDKKCWQGTAFGVTDQYRHVSGRKGYLKP